MTYLDAGCFVKLYYPEPHSAKVIALIQDKPVCYTPLHELEFVNALQLKVFFKSATAAQVTAARSSVEADLKSGVLVSPGGDWKDIFQEAVKLAKQHTGRLDAGCWTFCIARLRRFWRQVNLSAQTPGRPNLLRRCG